MLGHDPLSSRPLSTIAVVTVDPVATAPGSTLTALNAGSVAMKWVAAIEGYKNLLTDATPGQATTAWATGTGYTAALGGLHVELENHQKIDPWEPFHGAGNLVLRITQDSADTFGTDTHKRASGAETLLTATADRDDTTLSVKDTVNPTAFAASGDAYIGTECVGYTAKTATSFTTVTRGKYTPFPATATSFGEHHRVGFVASSPKLEPIVTAAPRVWLGKWVGAWMHRIADSLLNVKADARLMYAGRIVEIQDDPSPPHTAVTVKHVLDYVKEATVGREMYRAKVKAGVYLQAPMRFRFRDVSEGAAEKTATDLVVKASGASGANEINAGHYRHEDLHNAINTWLTSELAATRIYGTYTIYQGPEPNTDGLRTKIRWTMVVAGTPGIGFRFWMPQEVLKFFGFTQEVYMPGVGPGIQDIAVDDGSDNFEVAPNPPEAEQLTWVDDRLKVYDEIGTFRDQFATMPVSAKPTSANGQSWGIFLIGGKVIVRGARVSDEIQSVSVCLPGFGGTVADPVYKIAPSEDGMIDIKQIYIFEDSLANMLKRFFYSTGTTGYNDATYDTLYYGLGLGIPNPLLGTNFNNSVDALPGASNTIIVVIDKPAKFSEVFSGDLILRRAFLRWKDGGLQFGQWVTPTSGSSVANLGESTKAEPAGNTGSHRSSKVETTEWQRSIVKIDYNRDITDVTKDGGYLSSLTFEDNVAIDDGGGEGTPFTIKARNVYGQFAQTGQGIEALAPGYLVMFPLFSRPSHKLTRSIDSRYFESVAIGDVVLLTDKFARDPDTGARTITARPALITRHRASVGGLRPGQSSPSAMGGEVDLLLLEHDRFAAYVPCAQVDDTATVGNFVSGYSDVDRTLRCYARKYAEVSESIDANNFAAGDKIRITEIDPADPAAPTTWDRIVDTIVSSDITLTVALSSPAWDSTKKYRIVFDDYTDCVTSQQSKAFQADDVDALIQNSRVAFEYAVPGFPTWVTYTANAASDPVELMPNNCFGDGVGRDVGHELALVRLVNNLLDYKQPLQAPLLNNTVMSGTGATGTYKLVDACPIFLSYEQLTSLVTRSLSVAPWFRSTDGNSATVRVSLTRHPPSQDSVNDVDRGAVFIDASWSTTATTWAAGAATDLDIASVKDLFAGAVLWLWIECTVNAETRGFAKCTEGPRI